MGTKNNPGDYDCYSKADPDEPMFVLLGRDRDAADVVSYWVDVKLARGKAGSDPKIQEALRCADAMEKWAKEHPK